MQIGLLGQATTTVQEHNTAKAVKSGAALVFSTPMLVALMEQAAQESLAPYLKEGDTSVGIMMNMKHVSATPVGMTCTARSEVTHISENGKIITFALKAYDDRGLIGEGTHERAIVNLSRFEQKAQQKLSD